MLRLQSSGLVESRHGVGTFVLAPDARRTLLSSAGNDITTHDMLAMLELRISVETDADGLAASRRTEAHLTATSAALDAFGAVHQARASTVEADFQVHLQIAMATGNRYFLEVLSGLGNTTIIMRRQGSADKPQFGETHPCWNTANCSTCASMKKSTRVCVGVTRQPPGQPCSWT